MPEPLVRFAGIAAPFPFANVDTDRIIPARFLVGSQAQGYGQHQFYDMRYTDSGQERADFVLNQPAYRNARILVAGDNFGCGSSREMAVWALTHRKGDSAKGFRVIIAPSFADIFYNNCCKNGLAPVRLSQDEVTCLWDELHASPGAEVTVDLSVQTVRSPSGRSFSFSIDDFRRRSLMEGLDEIAMTEQYGEAFEAFEAQRQQDWPWLFAKKPSA